MKRFSLRPLFVAMSLALTGAAYAADGAPPSIWSFSGFGTVSAVHSSESEADFVGTIFQPNGAGRTDGTNFNPDSKLGAQLVGKFTPDLSGVVQVVSQHQYDNTYTPQIEWANLKYEFSPSFSARIGRIALPAFLLSETRYVGFANMWARAPVEVYAVLPVTSNDGADASYHMAFGDAVNTLQVFAGSSDAKIPEGDVKSKRSWGLNNTLEMGATTLRAGFISTNLDLTTTAIQGLMANFQAFGTAASAGANPAPVRAAGAQALALHSEYDPHNMTVKTYSVGFSHDAGDWLAVGEFVRFDGQGVLSTSDSWYLSAGRRFGDVTPYLTLGNTHAYVKAESGITAFGNGTTAALNGGINYVLQRLGATQSLASVGVRWDLVKNVALKAQFDHIELGAHSRGRYASNTSAAYQSGGKANLVTLGVDFLF